MRTLLLPLGLAATLFGPFHSFAQTASAATPLTLERALELATTHSPAIAAARHEVEASDGAIRQAGAWRNPELSTSIEDTRRETRTTTATINLPVELGGKRAARGSAADRARDVAQAQLSDAQAQVRASVIAAYFATLVAQERFKLATNSADLAERGAEAVARRVAAGKVSPVDETRARVDQANTQLEAAEAGAELQSARRTLAALWGDYEPAFTAVQGDIAATPTRASHAELAQQLDASPALMTSRLEADRRRALIEVERSKATPDMTVSLGAKRNNELGLTQAVIGVSIPLPLFDRNQGAIYEAGKRAQRADDEYQLARARALTDLQQASSQLAVARTSLQVLQSTVLPAAQRAYDAARQGFEAGKFGLLDVLDAQRALLQARTRYLNTLSAAYQAATAIDRLLGR